MCVYFFLNFGRATNRATSVAPKARRWRPKARRRRRGRKAAPAARPHRACRPSHRSPGFYEIILSIYRKQRRKGGGRVWGGKKGKKGRGARSAVPEEGAGRPPPPKIAQACLLLYLRAGPPRPGRAPAGPGRAPAGRAGPGWQKK